MPSVSFPARAGGGEEEEGGGSQPSHHREDYKALPQLQLADREESRLVRLAVENNLIFLGPQANGST